MANIKSNRSFKLAEASKEVKLDGDTIRRILVLRSDGGVLKSSQTVARADGQELSGYEKRRSGFHLLGALSGDGTATLDAPGGISRRAGSPLGRSLDRDRVLIAQFTALATRNGYTVS